MRAWVIASILLVGTGVALSACAENEISSVIAVSQDETLAIFEGGRLYDKWWAELNVAAPATTHPSYPATGKQKGANTWRCNECHGWDYLGKDGAYAYGPHFTGIKGIREMSGRRPDEVIRVLRDDVHRYTKEMMDDVSTGKLARFVTFGQADFNRIVDARTKRAIGGDLLNGQVVFDKVCAKCHGTDGRKINFSTSPKKEFIGTKADENPWEFFSKVRNGQPGNPEMTHSLGWIPMRVHLDILLYAQMLPVK